MKQVKERFDEDHVGGVTIRISTAVSNGLILHLPGDI
jgi:hypothetical protein